VKNPSRLSVFILLFFILSIFSANCGLIGAKPSIVTQNISKNETRAASPLKFQHYLTSGITIVTPSKVACENSLSDKVVMPHSIHDTYFINRTEGEIRIANHFPLQYLCHFYQVKARNSPDMLTTDLLCVVPDPNANENSEGYTFQDIDTNPSERLPYVGQFSEVGPNIGALAAMGTDSSILNSTNARPEASIASNSYYDVRGINIGALAAVAADKAIIDATITQLNGSAITINVAKNTIQKGNNQSISITLADKLTKRGLQNASIDGWITDSSGISMDFFSGLTNSSGMLSSSWKIASDIASGKATVFAEAYHKGYQRSAKSSSFQVTP
jgi:hypothetical protein